MCNQKRSERNPQFGTTQSDSLEGFRVDSITGKKYVTVDTIFWREPTNAELDSYETPSENP